MIIIKTPADIEIMKRGGKILSRVFDVVKETIVIGMNAEALDTIVRNVILGYDAEPSFLGYRGYRHSTCISKNEEIVHGIPYADKIFLPGDIVSVDIGVYYQGFHVDCARTFMMEPVAPDVEKLVRVTQESFFEILPVAKAGNRLGDISSAIQTCVEKNGLTVVKDLYSHGVGRELHEDPLIPNYGKRGKGIVLEAGMTFAIEPMVNLGTSDILTLPDKWTIITADRKWSAHYENTICIGVDGPEVLTQSN